MATKIFQELPTISRNYYLAGATTTAAGFKAVKNQKPWTRAERFDYAEKHFSKAYKYDNGKPLPMGAAGLVVIQISLPFGRETTLGPQPTQRCEAVGVAMERALRHLYVYESRTYLLHDGKIERLLDSGTVLFFQAEKKAIEKIMNFSQWLHSENMGMFLLNFGKGAHPYRVWRVEKTEMDFCYLAVSLLNGVIFELAPEGMPEMIPAPLRITVGDIRFRPMSPWVKDSLEADYVRF